ncbi:MAG: hypothetical protein EXR85_09070 [Xanthomonadales bacterium]|nr:hypothetical protein [Xanthomonadales bacterium]
MSRIYHEAMDGELVFLTRGMPATAKSATPKSATTAAGLAVVLCAVMLCCACSSAPRSATPAPNDLSASSFEQIQTPLLIELPAGKDLAISNSFGDIHVRQSADASVQMTLHLQRTPNSKAQARITRKTSGTSLELAVNTDQDKSRKEVLRIDLVVFVPPQPQLELVTQHGAIDVRKIDNPLIDAASDSGELVLTTRSVMRARSKTGRIRATIMQPGWSGESRIASDSGPVQVFFPLSPNLHLLATSGASIHSEFQLDIKQDGKGARVELDRGDGSDRLVIASHRGEVQLYSVVFNPADYPGK